MRHRLLLLLASLGVPTAAAAGDPLAPNSPRPGTVSPTALWPVERAQPSLGVTLPPLEPWVPIDLGGSSGSAPPSTPRTGASVESGILGALLAGVDDAAPAADPPKDDAAATSSPEHGDGQAGLSNEALAKLSQNPVANLISVPFQYNANFGFGPDDDVQSVLNMILQGYWNAERPDPVGEWTMRFQVSLLFPR